MQKRPQEDIICDFGIIQLLEVADFEHLGVSFRMGDF